MLLLQSFRAVLAASTACMLPVDQRRLIFKKADEAYAQRASTLSNTLDIAHNATGLASMAAATAGVPDMSVFYAKSALTGFAQISQIHPSFVLTAAKGGKWTFIAKAPQRTQLLDELWSTLEEELLNQELLWSFWVEWYNAIRKGEPLDWDLSFRIVKELTEADWEKGGDDWEASARHVARRIAEIRAEWEAEQNGSTEVTPEPVDPAATSNLFEKAPLVTASLASMSASISLGIDAFERMARPNEPVPMVEAMRALPRTAQRICELLEAGKGSDAHDTALALEVGRLRAEVARLQAELKAAHGELEELRKKTWYRSASVVFSAGVLSAVVTGVWALSGDEKSLETRWNKLAVDLKFLQSKVWPEPEDRFDEPFRYELPEAFDA
jgi:outer membrane murein-binding lipoprotein Lpp